MRMSDWSSDVCSSDLIAIGFDVRGHQRNNIRVEPLQRACAPTIEIAHEIDADTVDSRFLDHELVTRQFGGDAITIGHSFGNEPSLSTTDKTTVKQMEPAKVHTSCVSRRGTTNKRRKIGRESCRERVCQYV